MTVAQRRAWSEFGVDRRHWVVSGVFAVGGATYQATFAAEDEFDRFLDFLFSAPDKPETSRLYLHPNVTPLRAEDHLSNLRFQFDAEQGVGAAVLLVVDRDRGEVLSWMSAGDAGSHDVVLAHDSWNEHETRFPRESFVTIPELRQAVAQWAFGEVVPPRAVRWQSVPHGDVGWF